MCNSVLTASAVSLIEKILLSHFRTPWIIPNSPLSKLTLLLTASTSTVESSPTILPLKLPVIDSEAILEAVMAPVNVAAPAFTSFEVLLKKLVLSDALTSPVNVPLMFAAPVVLLSNTVESSPMMLALMDPALISSVTCKAP